MALGTPTSIGSLVQGTSTTNIITLTTTAQADVGDTVVVAVGSSTISRTLSSVSDSAGNTYTIDATSNDGTNAENLYFASARITSTLASGQTITATFANSVSSARGIAAMKVSGVTATSRVDTSGVNTGTTSGWQSTTASATSQADVLLVAAGWFASTASSTPGNNLVTGGAPYTELSDTTASSRSIVLEYSIVSAINTYRGTGTWSAGGSRQRSAVVAYKADVQGAFTNTVPPSVSGSLQVGATLTASPGTWSPTPGSFTYGWHRADDNVGTNLVEISPATGSTYTIDSADAGKYLQALVVPNVT